MKQLYKFTSILFCKGLPAVLMWCILTCNTAGQGIPANKIKQSLTTVADSGRLNKAADTTRLPVVQPADTATIPGADSTLLKQKTDTFSLKLSKDSLDAPLRYQAEDSAVVLVGAKKILLYGKTKTDYKDITLDAPQVEVDQATQIVTAVNRKDSTGAVVETAHFKSGSDEFTSDTIRYNFKTQIGLTRNTYTQQSEFLVIADQAKKVSENVTFIKRAALPPACLMIRIMIL